MLRSYKTEIAPTPKQIDRILRTIGTCRYIYNFYLSHNKEIYEKEGRFVSGEEFSKWLNNSYIPQNPDKKWIKEVSSKSVKKSMMNADNAFRRFFKGISQFPNYKKKGVNESKMYFVKNDKKTIISCERNRIKIPTLGWVKLKEKDYFPTNPITHKIKSGTVSIHAGRFYVSILVETKEERIKYPLQEEGIGVDLGLHSLVVASNGMVKPNVNHTKQMRNLEKKLKREQRSLSRKYKDFEKRKKVELEKEKKGEATKITRQNINKQKRRVQRLYQKMTNIRTNYINQCVNELVKTKPAYITIEDLNVSGMMKNKHLSKAIAEQKWYEFRVKLTAKCKEYGIELRIADRWYPSSKTCHKCGMVKKDLKLSDRIFICTCGEKEDRDYNASLNLRDTKNYQIA